MNGIFWLFLFLAAVAPGARLANIGSKYHMAEMSNKQIEEAITNREAASIAGGAAAAAAERDA